MHQNNLVNEMLSKKTTKFLTEKKFCRISLRAIAHRVGTAVLISLLSQLHRIHLNSKVLVD